VVGTGPGGFTGLRVGLATAKTLAHGLGRPIVGIGTAEALAEAALASEGAGSFGARPPVTVILPAGPRDRYLVPVPADGERPRLLAPAALADWLAGPGPGPSTLIAVDLDDPAIPATARARGAAALVGLGRVDDVAALVPAYVTLPRGVGSSADGAAWSPDLR